MTPEYRHIPVLVDECLAALDLHDGDVCLDCTLGGAGHSVEMAKRIAPDGTLVGIDQDESALEAAEERLAETGLAEPPVLIQGNFADLDELLVEARIPGVDAVLFDLGVSSPQFDRAERGFSYRMDAPLDMRMSPETQELTAAEVLATYSEEELARVFCEGGEEKWGRRIAHLVVQERSRKPVETTFDLVDLVKRAIPASARRSGGHPAKRSFQALRVEVNHEMDALERGLEAAIRWLNPLGRIAVISYQSAEDKVVKRVFRDAEDPCTCPPDLPVCACGKKPVLQVKTRKAVVASDEEVERNPRAHSARMRAAVKLEQAGT